MKKSIYLVLFLLCVTVFGFCDDWPLTDKGFDEPLYEIMDRYGKDVIRKMNQFIEVNENLNGHEVLCKYYSAKKGLARIYITSKHNFSSSEARVFIPEIINRFKAQYGTPFQFQEVAVPEKIGSPIENLTYLYEWRSKNREIRLFFESKAKNVKDKSKIRIIIIPKQNKISMNSADVELMRDSLSNLLRLIKNGTFKIGMNTEKAKEIIEEIDRGDYSFKVLKYSESSEWHVYSVYNSKIYYFLYFGVKEGSVKDMGFIFNPRQRKQLDEHFNNFKIVNAMTQIYLFEKTGYKVDNLEGVKADGDELNPRNKYIIKSTEGMARKLATGGIRMESIRKLGLLRIRHWLSEDNGEVMHQITFY